MKAQECLYFSLLPITVLVETFILRPKYSMFGLSTNRSFKKKERKCFNLPVEQDGTYLFLSLQNQPMPSKIVL